MKKYMAPVTEIMNMESFAMICISKLDRDYDISDNSGNNPYQNPDWADDGEIGDDGDLSSTGKDGSDPWDEVDDEE